MKNPKITRREFIGSLAATATLANAWSADADSLSKIDRFALVSRHNPIIHKFEPLSPLSVGNGEFAFTCDVTGLQTFPEIYADAMPLCTMSQWGWHTTPRPASIKDALFKPTEYESYGRNVPYITGKTGQDELYNWLRENPHRLHLGRIGFRLVKAEGSEAKPSDITAIEQQLDLWSGTIHSRFRFEGESVAVRTTIHPALDLLAIAVESRLIVAGKLSISIKFPYASSAIHAAEWASSDKHRSDLWYQDSKTAVIDHFLDSDLYSAGFKSSGGSFEQKGPHEFLLRGRETGVLDFSAYFTPQVTDFKTSPVASEIFSASEVHWRKFWTVGAAVDLSESKDPRANELERRVVLSQYLTAINCSGSTPPQETGLTCNSWYGKFHLEMHWWHAAHFALWNRLPMLEKSLGWYSKILPSAKERAQEQGYDGARWPKMTSPDGRDSPSPIGPLLIWQQPHPIFYAELAYLNRPTAATLRAYQEVVHETAKFMASYAHFDEKTTRYVLGPPVIPAQENHPPRETWNPTFELEYWHFGLATAQKWLERRGQKRDPKCDDIIRKLSPLPAKDGVYLAHENCPQTFTERNKDHPSMLAALGVLTGEKVDRDTMSRTLKKVMKEWDWAETWGWDYPMTAMTAARVGEPSTAIDALLLDTPKNHYAINGHNYQRPNLPLYLPGNGGLLYAIALMTNGWKGSPKRNAPGFPNDGSWTVRSEGFNKSLFQEI
ncbi:MAG: glycoside hydrolase family 65 [Acidobacteriota bacterium]